MQMLLHTVFLKRMEAHRDLQITGLTPDPNPTLPAVQAKPTPAAEPMPYRPPGPLKGIGLHRYSVFVSLLLPFCFSSPLFSFFCLLSFSCLLDLVLTSLQHSPFTATLSEDTPEHDTTPAGRRHCDVVKFRERNGLELVGMGWHLVRSEE
jgi:hypothetical protein